MTTISALAPPTAIPAPVAANPDATDSDAPGVDVPDLNFADIWADSKGMSFSDLLDIINPLQHIPIISTIYRAITGDRIGLGARLIGGGLFGGPIGLAGTGVMLAFEQASGSTVDNHLIAMFQDVTGGGTSPQGVAVAKATTAGPEGAAVARATTAGPDDQAPAEPETAPLAPPQPPRAAGIPPFAPSRSARNTPQPPPALRPLPALPAPDAAAIPPGTPRPGGVNPGASPAAALAPDANPAVGGRRHVAQAIRAAEKTQAELLIASLASGLYMPIAGRDATTRIFPKSTPEGFAGHPNLMPPGASPQWIGLAIERALLKYRQSSNLSAGRTTAATAPPPR